MNTIQNLLNTDNSLKGYASFHNCDLCLLILKRKHGHEQNEGKKKVFVVESSNVLTLPFIPLQIKHQIKAMTNPQFILVRNNMNYNEK